MGKLTLIGEKIENSFGWSWSRKCSVNQIEYNVSVSRGKSVRIAYKPRGQNRGWHWHGSVYCNGKNIWSGRVPKSIGVRGLLIEAGII